jgi:cysteine synthase
MHGIASSVLDLVGHTPVVRINRLAPPHVELFVKVEAANPLGSVKDRLAVGLIEAAERSGALRPGQTVIEATSGNTGIGLAMVCAAKGYPLVIVMAESFSLERRKLLRFLGARLVLTPAAAKGSGMLATARALADKHGWYLCRQFENETNADVHSATTAIEILDVFGPDALDYWVTGFGTGGTLKGVARVLRERSPRTKVVACEPDNSALLASGRRQAYDGEGRPCGSHPSFRPHPMQGWAPDFVPKLADDARAAGLIDELVGVPGDRAFACARDLAQQEGLFCGTTSGATFAAALDVAAQAPAGARILAMLPDTGERYLSTPLFADVPVAMTEEELAIAATIEPALPPGPAPVAAAPAPPPVGAEAAAFVETAIVDPDAPLVMFALKWCEFCWSVRRLFDAAGIAYRSIELDDPAFCRDNDVDAIRAALAAKAGAPTIPQLFLAGRHIGGCTDALDAFAAGTLQRDLGAAGISFDAERALDPHAFLPNWGRAA